MLRVTRLLVSILIILSSFAAAMERQPNTVYRARREALAAKTKDAVILFAPTESEGPNAIYGFRQEDDFYYLTGLTEPGAGLLISAAGGKHGYVEVLFLPGRNVSQEKWTGPKLTSDSADAKERTGFDAVMPLDAMRNELARVLPTPRAVVYTDTDEKSASAGPVEWLRRANAFPNYVGFPDVKQLIHQQRAFKDKGEIELVRKATDASVAGHLAVMRAMKPGLSEQEISALFQYEFLRRGCERPAYAPIVGSGFNGTVLHYSQNSGKIQDGDLVVMDVAGEYSMYASDITRTLPANGKFTARQREIYEIVLGAQQAAIDAFKSGVSNLRRGIANSLHEIAANYINSHGKDLHGQSLGQYFIHGLSHHVGLSVHDPAGGADDVLRPGMIFTIEPGIYLPEEKLGVRIEDVFLVGEDGSLINLSGALPRTVADVEKAMAEGRK
ncbi:MAG: aminopeptidase P N-terminal domain-containing protein [Acidobacteriales bacterium]|nr:aminopeptidase P N-terminal domain-containing protein [Terriglobales bacterium]